MYYYRTMFKIIKLIQVALRISTELTALYPVHATTKACVMSTLVPAGARQDSKAPRVPSPALRGSLDQDVSRHAAVKMVAAVIV
jgi:hypothetical protein